MSFEGPFTGSVKEGSFKGSVKASFKGLFKGFRAFRGLTVCGFRA